MKHPKIASQIWDKKYRFKMADGTPLDETVQDTWLRIAKALAAPEDTDNPGRYIQDFFYALEDYKFLLAGRISESPSDFQCPSGFYVYL